MRRMIVALVISASLASPCFAARDNGFVREDIVPDADAAKRIARSIVESSMKPASYEERWAHKFLSAELKGGVWTVEFTELDPGHPLVAGPGEVIVTADRGGYAKVRLSKRNAKVLSLYFGR